MFQLVNSQKNLTSRHLSTYYQCTSVWNWLENGYFLAKTSNHSTCISYQIWF